MRISDWSSDVCSSDLEADFESLDLMVIGGQSVATRINNIREVGVLVQDTNQISAGAQGFDVLEDYKPRDEESMNLPAELRRSEEHTSELQSLMRISYAVFCLKKTNRQAIGQKF